MHLQPPRRDQHEGMCCPGASGQDGPAGEGASKESSGIWEGKQRCASAAGQATPTQPSFPAAQVRCTGPPAESWPLLSMAPDFLRPARLPPVPDPELWGLAQPRKKINLVLHAPNRHYGPLPVFRPVSPLHTEIQVLAQAFLCPVFPCGRKLLVSMAQ